MAVDRSDNKENLPPATAPSSAVGRLHGIAVKSCKLKRLSKARRRVPLRDITNLFVAVESAVPVLQQELPQPPEVTAEVPQAQPAIKNGLAAGGAASKPVRYSLRKWFR
ncbi:uncharacterized protein LOC104581549 [Brachypodium distachyon]|uniref:Uncharacterized protein n=1 Tax=Brachypodium distachyon TaxID=15368 RepID=A0A0Q3K1L8_BRADI|nr:uncharacterized protein LOC104581549 [Brachypodium distachyon]KQK18116.1 hypothetical protein BRADI_1g38905v3 [Brachypodium distachyon]|eukprot:XP_010227647.1 uncharacterized protein LOC104581549 [Brachypodium distachyon]